MDELDALVGEYPGELYGAKQRLGEIEFAFRGLPGVTSYFDEKVGKAIEFLGIWRSALRWRKWGEDYRPLHAIVLASLSQMRSVIEQHFRDTLAAEPQAQDGALTARPASPSRGPGQE